ncbi:MAG: metal ABC transporter solute-binding protein, Zn/Mn family [Microbacteriaceae bacterium]
MRRLLAVTVAAAVAAGALLGLAGCSSTEVDDGRISVVASTNVWGNIAELIGGDQVSVFSVIHDDSQDPHEFAAGANDLLRVSRAAVVIENGRGYDDFMDQLLDAADPSAAVVTVSDLAHTGVENEHYWFDFVVVGQVADALAARFATLDSAHAADFVERNAAFHVKLDGLQQRAEDIASTHPGRSALLTEPLPYYLLTAAGFSDVTPPGLSLAVEAGTEIPPTALNESRQLLSGHQVNLLARNAQTDSAQIDQLISAASSAGLPVIEFRELLPAGSQYIDWMNGYLTELERVS